MRRLTKNTSAKAIKEIRKTIMAMGGIESTARNNGYDLTPMWEFTGNLVFKTPRENEFILDTPCGPLWLKIDCAEGNLGYAVWGRFDHSQRSSRITGNRNGKFNFISGRLETIKCNLFNLIWLDLGVNGNRSVITDFDDLEEMIGKSYDVENAIMVMDGKYIQNTRMCVIKPSPKINFDFKNWRNKLIVMVDGCAHLVGKRTEFQLIWDGVRTESK